MTPQPNNLWALQGQLFELMEAREESLALLETARSWRGDFEASPVPQAEAELTAIETAIGDFIRTKVSEVTEIRASYLALIDAAAVAKAEARRAENRAMLLENRGTRLKDLIKQCMETLGIKRFESAMGYFLIKGNGGKQPVEITDESLVPDEYCRFTLTLPGEFWTRFLISLAQASDVPEEVLALRVAAKREPSKSAINEVLNQPCGECEGAGEKCRVCIYCGGSGKRGVPGARLSDRGSSLQIK